MVDTIVEEPITAEELIELGCALEKVKDQARSALQILKVLERKKITAELLVETKIGKKLSMVKDDYADDTKVAGDIILYKAGLKKKWQIIYKKSKPVNEEELLRKK